MHRKCEIGSVIIDTALEIENKKPIRAPCRANDERCRLLSDLLDAIEVFIDGMEAAA